MLEIRKEISKDEASSIMTQSKDKQSSLRSGKGEKQDKHNKDNKRKPRVKEPPKPSPKKSK